MSLLLLTLPDSVLHQLRGLLPISCSTDVSLLHLLPSLLSCVPCRYREGERAEVRAAGLVERLAAMAERRLPGLSPAQLAETLDALARLEYRAPASFLKVRQGPSL